MTVNGTIMKTTALLFLVIFGASFTWSRTLAGSPPVMWIIGGAIGGFIMVLATMFKPTWAPVTAPVYAALEGLFLGGISAVAQAAYPGIVFNAVCLTFGIMFSMLFLFQTGIISVTQKFRAGVMAATTGIFLIYMVSWVLSFFSVSVPFIHEGGVIGIGFSLFVIVVATLNLVLDFDFISQGAEAGLPKHMEWVGAVGLLVTLVWLYIEILRLLMKLQNRD